MHMLQAASIPVEESGAKYRAAQVRSRIAAFRELAELMREADTGLVLETMEDYATRNAEEEFASVDLRTAEVPR